jgi:hypothetical protein
VQAPAPARPASSSGGERARPATPAADPEAVSHPFSRRAGPGGPHHHPRATHGNRDETGGTAQTAKLANRPGRPGRVHAFPGFVFPRSSSVHPAIPNPSFLPPTVRSGSHARSGPLEHDDCGLTIRRLQRAPLPFPRLTAAHPRGPARQGARRTWPNPSLGPTTRHV